MICNPTEMQLIAKEKVNELFDFEKIAIIVWSRIRGLNLLICINYFIDKLIIARCIPPLLCSVIQLVVYLHNSGCLERENNNKAINEDLFILEMSVLHHLVHRLILVAFMGKHYRLKKSLRNLLQMAR